MARPILVSAGALIDRDGRVLMATRPPGKRDAGLWEFPGGKIEADETPEAALVRELNEELRVSTEASCLAPFAFATGDHGGLLLLLFVCRKWSGVPVGQEGQSVRWVEARQLLELEMPAVDRPLAAQVRDYLSGA